MASKFNFTLTYFPIRGRAEITRLALEDRKIPYKNVVPEDWKSMKSTTAFGQLPHFQDGDFPMVQSNSILRHVGRRVGDGLYGKDIFDQSRIDMLIDGCEDVRMKYVPLIYQDQCSEAGVTKYLGETLPPWLEKFEAQLKTNNGGKSYLVGDNFTIADAAMFEILDIHVNLSKTCLDKFPLLSAYHARVAARPGIADYIKSGRRPAKINGNGKGQPQQ